MNPLIDYSFSSFVDSERILGIKKPKTDYILYILWAIMYKI